MHLIGYDTARLTTLFLAASKTGQPYLPKAVALLVERYKFAAFPTKVEELVGERVSFGQGLFGDAAIETLEIYGDGVIVSSKSNSDILDEFMADLCEWMEASLGLKRVETHEVSKSYESRLLIHSEVPLLRALDALSPIQEMVGRALKKTTNLDVKFEGFGLSIAADHSSIPGMKPIAFRLERKATVAFDKNYYASAAPLPSAEHMKVLERLEKLV